METRGKRVLAACGLAATIAVAVLVVWQSWWGDNGLLNQGANSGPTITVAAERKYTLVVNVCTRDTPTNFRGLVYVRPRGERNPGKFLGFGTSGRTIEKSVNLVPGDYEIYGIAETAFIAVPQVITLGTNRRVETAIEFAPEVARVVTVRVLDRATSRPVNAARAWVMESGIERTLLWAGADGTISLAFSGTLRDLRADHATLVVTAPGYATQTVTLDTQFGDAHEVLLEPAGYEVVFELYDAQTGLAVQGVALRGLTGNRALADIEAVSDEDGRIAMRVTPARYALEAVAEGYVTWTSTDQPQGAMPLGQQPQRVSIALEPTMTLVVNLLGPDGKSVETGSFRCWWCAIQPGVREQVVTSSPAAQAGSVLSVSPLRPGLCEFTIWVQGFACADAKIRMSARREEVELVLRPADTVRAWLIDVAGLELSSVWTGDGPARDVSTRGRSVVIPGRISNAAALRLRLALDAQGAPRGTAALVDGGAVVCNADFGAVLITPLYQVVPLRASQERLIPDGTGQAWGELAVTVKISSPVAGATYFVVATPVAPGHQAAAASTGMKAKVDPAVGATRLLFVPEGEYLLAVLRVTETELSWDVFQGKHRVRVEPSQVVAVDLR